MRLGNDPRAVARTSELQLIESDLLRQCRGINRVLLVRRRKKDGKKEMAAGA